MKATWISSKAGPGLIHTSLIKGVVVEDNEVFALTHKEDLFLLYKGANHEDAMCYFEENFVNNPSLAELLL